MIKLHERYVVASNGKKVGVLLPVARYRKLLAEIEELAAIRAYDAAKASGDKAISFQQAKTQLRRRR